MNYDKMLCLVRDEDRSAIENTIDNALPVEFAQSAEDFRNKVTSNSYCVVSLPTTDEEFDTLKELMAALPEQTFYGHELLPDGRPMTDQASDFMTLENTEEGQYRARELRDNYLGKIDDLWRMRLSSPLPFSDDFDRACSDWCEQNKITALPAEFFAYFLKLMQYYCGGADARFSDDDAYKFATECLEGIKLSLMFGMTPPYNPTKPEDFAQHLADILEQSGVYLKGISAGKFKALKRNIYGKMKQNTFGMCDSDGKPMYTIFWVDKVFDILEKDYGVVPRETLGLTPEMGAAITIKGINAYMSKNDIDPGKMDEALQEETLSKILDEIFKTDKLYRYYDEAKSEGVE
jgi:hypothetical protein